MHYDKLLPDKIYHIYNHAVGNENLFRNNGNYQYFLKLFDKYISPVAYTFAYCLMPNHFHLLIKIKDKKNIASLLPPDKKDINKFVIQQFSNFFNAYTKAYNNVYERRGRLFTYPFRRRLVTDEKDFTAVMAYIHNNPVHHGFVPVASDWKYSSFESFYDSRPSKLLRDIVETLFGKKENFEDYHNNFNIEKYALEMQYAY